MDVSGCDLIDWQERSSEDSAIALHYHHGLPIVLLRGEIPIAPHWDHHTYSVEEIEYEFQRDPNLNIGLVLGKRSGLMEITTDNIDGGQSEADYYELVDNLTLLTPTFTSKTAHHRIFKQDERLLALDKFWLDFKSITIRTGAWGGFSILPPSVTQGVRREWRLHPDDCRGRFDKLPYFAVEKLLAAHETPPAARQTVGAVLG